MKITKSKLRQIIQEELNSEQPNLEEAAVDISAEAFLMEAAELLTGALDFAGREGVPSNHPHLLRSLQEAKNAVSNALRSAQGYPDEPQRSSTMRGIPGV
jgi:hypothetical protein